MIYTMFFSFLCMGVLVWGDEGSEREGQLGEGGVMLCT